MRIEPVVVSPVAAEQGIRGGWFVRLAAIACCGSVGIAGAGSALPKLDRVYAFPEPRPIADFVLTDQDGRQRSFSSLRGHPALVFFGFAHCANVCPATLQRLATLHASNGGALKAARIVLISVDGDRDTPAGLKRFLAQVSPDFIGLTGEPRTTAAIAARFPAAFFKEPAAKDGSYNVGHSAEIFAIDKQGRLRAVFDDASVDAMAQVTAILLAEPG
jgi:protein SCO1/2